MCQSGADSFQQIHYGFGAEAGGLVAQVQTCQMFKSFYVAQKLVAHLADLTEPEFRQVSAVLC